MESNLPNVHQQEIENRILTIRGIQVMIDRDLSELYAIPTKRLNEQVKRNIERFPEHFCFQLTQNEKEELVTICDRFEMLKHSSTLPNAFTEQGVAMLSAVLRSEIAVKVSIQIMTTFVEMRKMILNNAGLFQRLDKIENKQLQADANFERIFNALANKELKPDKGVFFDGQVFDAYTFFADLIRDAKSSIILIDNYIDDTVFSLFAKRNPNVKLTIYTKSMNKQLMLDVQKFNSQYAPLLVKELPNAHDRFLIIDHTELYHIGASLKDLGKKWFAFSKMNDELNAILNRLSQSN